MKMNDKSYIVAGGDSKLGPLRHSQKTNIADGRISNHDAALLIMAESQDGVSRTGEVIAALRRWRQRPLQFTYLFNTSPSGGYGFVGKNIESVFNRVYRDTGSSNRRTYWYRLARGHYRITIEGYRRIGELAQNK